ncbi:hypothetical protein TNCV_1109851 [Trichonephila clavipes]|nr:hypothetical protein TNCV_1109851 [Trichonephila clavipes]
MNINFCVKKSATKTFQILTEAYEEETLSRAHVFEWHKRFLRGMGQCEIDDEQCRFKRISGPGHRRSMSPLGTSGSKFITRKSAFKSSLSEPLKFFPVPQPLGAQWVNRH